MQGTGDWSLARMREDLGLVEGTAGAKALRERWAWSLRYRDGEHVLEKMPPHRFRAGEVKKNNNLKIFW